MIFKHTLTFLLIACLSVSVFAQDKKKEGDKKKKEKTFKDIITEDAESSKGLFNIHKVKGKYYFEIPNDILEKEMVSNIICLGVYSVKSEDFISAYKEIRDSDVYKHENEILPGIQ